MSLRMSVAERSKIASLLEIKRNMALTGINAHNPGWKEEVELRKQKLAIGRLKIEKDLEEQSKLEDQIEALRGKLRVVESRISSKLPKKKKDQWNKELACPIPKTVCEAVTQICQEIHEVEMRKHLVGKKVLEVEAEYFESQRKLELCSTREDLTKHKVL